MIPPKKPETRFPLTVTQPTGRLDVFLSEQLGESRAFVQKQIQEGRILVNATVVTKTGTRLKEGDQVTGSLIEPETTNATPIEGVLDILFEDETLIVLNKSAGVVVHPGAGTRGATLVHHLLFHLQHSPFGELSPIRPGIVHRLDRGTTGVLVVAKTRHALENLSEQFKERKTKKVYQAVTWGELPPSGVWRSAVGRDRRNRKKMSSRTEVPRPAETTWKRLDCSHGLSWVELYPTTGRTHQLRVHLSEAGFPILADALYGGTASPGRVRPLPPELAQDVSALEHTLLHARQLTFSHPATGETLQFEAPVPLAFQRIVHQF